jgi:hypothetical protein
LVSKDSDTHLKIAKLTIGRTSYSIAVVLCTPSHYPAPLFPTVNPCPLALLDEAQIRAWRTVKRFPKNNSFVFDIVVKMHQLGLATSTEWHPEMDQRALSNLYFDAMKLLLSIQIEEPWTESLLSGVRGQEGNIMFSVWSAGLPLYIWATVRHLQSRLGLLVTPCHSDPILDRVRSLLDGAGGYHSWPRGKSLEPVLATLFYCTESCDTTNPRRVWAVEMLRKSAEVLRLKTFVEFKKTLDFFPITEEYTVKADEVWRELDDGNTAGETPTVVLPSFR